MSKTGRYNYRRPEKGRNSPTRPERHITVRGVRKPSPDLRKLGRVVIALALAEAEAEKAAADQYVDNAAEEASTDTGKEENYAD